MGKIIHLNYGLAPRPRSIERSLSVLVLALLSIQVLIPLSSGFSHDIDNELMEPHSRSSVTLEWNITFIESIGYQISTPTIADLNTDGKMDVVLHSSNGNVFALNSNGTFFSEPYITNGTDIAGKGPFTNLSGSYVPPFFSSPLAEDVNLGSTPEIIIGEKGGIVCIGSDGKIQWRTNITNATSISTPSSYDIKKLTDSYKSQIATIIEYANGSSYLELFEGDGDRISRFLITNSSLGASGSVVIDDMDLDEDPEFILVHPDRGLMVFSLNGTPGNWELVLDNRSNKGFGGYQASTPAIANLTGGPEKEILVILNQHELDPGIDDLMTVAYMLDRDLNDISVYVNLQPTYSSPVIAELDGNGSRKEIVLTTANGTLIVLDSKDYLGGMDHKWEFDTGGNILSSPAICDVDDDREPEIIVSTTDGMILCFDGDPSDGIDEGIPDVGGFTNVDMLWKYHLEEPTGTSSPVVADIDLDGYLEVLIGGENGSVFCLGIGPTHHLGKSEWPTFHGNNNRNGTYDISYYGVDIYARKDPETGDTIEELRKFVQPGSIVTYNLTIENTGEGLIGEEERQKFFVSVEQVSNTSGWKYFLDMPPDMGNDNPDYVKLGEGDLTFIQLRVFAPWEGDPGEEAAFKVYVNSSENNNTWDFVMTYTVLDLFPDFEMNFLKQPTTDPLDPLIGKKWDMITPGTEHLYTISILNKGNVNDTYDLSLGDPPTDLGWDWYFIETNSTSANVSLSAPTLAEEFGGITGISFTVRIICPDMCPGDSQIPVVLKGSSRYALSHNSSLEKEDTLILVVQSIKEFEIEVLDGPFSMIPGRVVEIPVYITNTGNANIIYVVLGLDGKQPGWKVEYTKAPVPVYQGQTRMVMVRFTLPENADVMAGDIFRFNISGSLDPGFIRNVTVTIYIERISSILTALNPDTTQYIDPGGSVDYQLLLVNDGTGDEIFNISVDPGLEDSDIHLVFMENITDEKFDLPWRGEMLLNFTVSAGMSAPLGLHRISIGIGSENGYFTEVEFEINITHLRSFNLIVPKDRNYNYLNMKPGEYQSFVIGIINDGNAVLDLIPVFGLRNINRIDQIDTESDDFSYSFDWISLMKNTSDLRGTDFMGTDVTVSNLFEDAFYRLDDHMKKGSFNIHIEQGEVLWIGMHFTLSHHNGLKPIRPMSLSFFVKETGINLRKSWEIEVSPLYADLEISEVDITNINETGEEDRYYDGDTIILTANMTNSGVTASEETTVRFYLDGESYELFDVGPMNPGEHITLTVSVKPEIGYHELTFEIDPMNYVFETNDQFMEGSESGSNIWGKTIEVKEKETEEEGLPIWLILLNVGLVLLVLMAVATFIILITRKRNLSGSKEE